MAFPFAFFPLVPLGVVLTAVLLLTLVYFAFVDTLYIGRLAGYVAILEAPPMPPPPVIPGTMASSIQDPVISPEIAMVDQDEVILSDTPFTSEEHQPHAFHSEMQSPHRADGSLTEQGEAEPGKTSPDENSDPAQS